jgi:hypothetical protein
MNCDWVMLVRELRGLGRDIFNFIMGMAIIALVAALVICNF